MAMVVKNNMSALSTLNTLNKNSSALSKSLQKVSSGMKINSAADDASGYAISERMRVQIRSLDQANQNTQNGSSMMKVAEGAVSSTVDILKTLKEKAVNAANDSNTDADRQTIQKELDQSIDQINDNANVTFNGKYLIDGSKNTVGKATYTSLSNQLLHDNTTGETKLTDLKTKNGDDLQITSTDKVTVSYVQAGKTYSTTYQVGDSTLQDIFENAEDIDKNSFIFADQGNESIKGAMTQEGETVLDDTKTKTLNDKKDALTTANKAYDSASKANDKAKAAYEEAAAGIKSAMAAYNGATANAGNLLTTTWDDSKSTADNLSALSKDGKFNSFIANTAQGGQAAFNALKTALSAYNGVTYAASMNADAIEVAADAATNGTLKDLYDAEGDVTTAKGEYKDAGGGVKILTGSSIGKAASDDPVSTASGRNALTITANNAGIGGQISGFNISITDSQGNVKKSANAALDAFGETIRAQNESQDNALSFQIGASANQSIKVGLTDMRAEALGLKGADGTTLNISTQTKANAAVNVLDNAIQKALDQQTTIGSVQSRLEYTSSNLTTTSENVQSSESTIRDADMAKEMMNYTKNNVLMQAAQSMLAQANQSSSNALSLLQ